MYYRKYIAYHFSAIAQGQYSHFNKRSLHSVLSLKTQHLVWRYKRMHLEQTVFP